MSDPIALTERFVVQADTARSMARTFVAYRFRMVRMWILLGLFYILMAILLLSGMDPDFRLRVRIVWALVFALAPLTVILVVCAVLAYVLGKRNIRRRIFDGAVLETGFGADALVFKGPLSEARISYHGITSVKRHGDFVFLRQVGVPVASVFPAKLFPAEAIERISAQAR